MYKNNYWFFILIFLLSLNHTQLMGQKCHNRIIVDGLMHDWEGCETYCSDKIDDGKDVDFTRMWVTNDEKYLFIRIQLAKPLSLVDYNSLFLEIDGDHNAATGYRVNGIGAELGWGFGLRYGFYKHFSSADYISNLDVRYVILPSFTSTDFEIAIKLDAAPIRNEKIFTADTIEILLWDKQVGGDLLPDSGHVFHYVIQKAISSPYQPLSIEPPFETSLRLMTWNVFYDGLIDTIRQPIFGKVFKAIQPDIIVMEECWHSQANEVKQLFDQWLPLQKGSWKVIHTGEGLMLVSRYPVVKADPIFVGDNRNIAAYSIKTDLFNLDTLLLIGVHLSCCAQDNERIAETQAIMHYLGKHYSIGRNEDKLLRLPVVIAGDFNLVGSEIPYRNIVSNQLTGAREPWFTDLAPHQIDRPMAYTWRDYSKIFSPSRLDYIFYSPLLNPIHSYIFNILYLDENSLKRYGLKPTDLRICSDHLPLVVDFVPTVSPK